MSQAKEWFIVLLWFINKFGLVIVWGAAYF